ncbi:hypothetical protein ACE4RR_09445 [Alteribacillus sp. HJP-4]
MPITLILCLLFTSFLLLQIKLFVNEKENLVLQEESLEMDWLIRNAEVNWRDENNWEEQSSKFIYPTGTVYITQTLIDNNNKIRTSFKAVTIESREKELVIFAEKGGE